MRENRLEQKNVLRVRTYYIHERIFQCLNWPTGSVFSAQTVGGKGIHKFVTRKEMFSYTGDLNFVKKSCNSLQKKNGKRKYFSRACIRDIRNTHTITDIPAVWWNLHRSEIKRIRNIVSITIPCAQRAAQPARSMRGVQNWLGVISARLPANPSSTRLQSSRGRGNVRPETLMMRSGRKLLSRLRHVWHLSQNEINLQE